MELEEGKYCNGTFTELCLTCPRNTGIPSRRPGGRVPRRLAVGRLKLNFRRNYLKIGLAVPPRHLPITMVGLLCPRMSFEEYGYQLKTCLTEYISRIVE